MLLNIRKQFNSIFKQQFSTSSILYRRPPPKEQSENNAYLKRKKTSDPFDRYKYIFE